MCWASIHADKMQSVRRPLGNERFIKVQQGFLRRMILNIQAVFFMFSLISFVCWCGLVKMLGRGVNGCWLQGKIGKKNSIIPLSLLLLIKY